MPNPFDNPDGQFSVLTNAEGHHSLWPGFADVPPGWSVVFGAADRESCMKFIRGNWTDMRPRSLRLQLGEPS
jgi:MbtH protein